MGLWCSILAIAAIVGIWMIADAISDIADAIREVGRDE